MHVKQFSVKANEKPSENLAYDNGEIVIKPYTKVAKISIIEIWTTAFLIFFLAKISDQTREHHKYMNIVLTTAFRSPGTIWLDYNIQFRLNHEIEMININGKYNYKDSFAKQEDKKKNKKKPDKTSTLN